jgi:hypothetical protein
MPCGVIRSSSNSVPLFTSRYSNPWVEWKLSRIKALFPRINAYLPIYIPGFFARFVPLYELLQRSDVSH